MAFNTIVTDSTKQALKKETVRILRHARYCFLGLDIGLIFNYNSYFINMLGKFPLHLFHLVKLGHTKIF